MPQVVYLVEEVDIMIMTGVVFSNKVSGEPNFTIKFIDSGFGDMSADQRENILVAPDPPADNQGRSNGLVRPKNRESIVPGEVLGTHVLGALFLKMNLLKFLASEEQAAGNSGKAEDLLQKAHSIRDGLVHHNTALAISRKARILAEQFGVDDQEALSLALRAICRAVEKFDVRRGCTFSTYAMSAIKNALWRGGQKKRERHLSLDELRVPQRSPIASPLTWLIDGERKAAEALVFEILRDSLRDVPKDESNQNTVNRRNLMTLARQLNLEQDRPDPDVRPKTNKVLGEELGITQNAVYERVQRAKNILRERLRRQFPGQFADQDPELLGREG